MNWVEVEWGLLWSKLAVNRICIGLSVRMKWFCLGLIGLS